MLFLFGPFQDRVLFFIAHYQLTFSIPVYVTEPYSPVPEICSRLFNRQNSGAFQLQPGKQSIVWFPFAFIEGPRFVYFLCIYKCRNVLLT